jgi:hypothetical protein
MGDDEIFHEMQGCRLGQTADEDLVDIKRAVQLTPDDALAAK